MCAFLLVSFVHLTSCDVKDFALFLTCATEPSRRASISALRVHVVPNRQRHALRHIWLRQCTI